MRVGIAADHGEFTLNGQVAKTLRGSGHEVVDFGAHLLNPVFGVREEPDFTTERVADVGFIKIDISRPNGERNRPYPGLTLEKTISIPVINPQTFAKLCNEGKKIELIDVRTPVEYREVHVEIARNVPLDQLDPAALMQARNGSANAPLYVICRSGSRAQQACEQFVKAGFPKVVSIEGGTMAWVEAGLPVVRGKKAISLERQVRIAAGSFVLLGAALSFVHPAFIGLSAFVGAGLVFAGITDTCGMGMILARMPWNQCSQDSTSCCAK